MQRLIKDKQIIANDWQLAGDDFNTASLSNGKWLLPFTVFMQALEQGLVNFDTCGPVLNAEDDSYSLKDIINDLKIVGLNFHAFADGRSFSHARVLRDQLDFEGEIRAMGNFIQDQLFYLSRCGVNAFLLPSEITSESALHSLNDFSESYQAASDEPQPLFRRRS